MCSGKLFIFEAPQADMIIMQVPVQTGTTQLKIEPPCFRCLFEKPISEGWCTPETCYMLDAWLLDEDFSWAKYVFKWLSRLEQENVNRLHPIENELE